MTWIIAGFAGIILAGLGTVVVIVWRLGLPGSESEPLPDHFPPRRDPPGQ